jgi:hypothetical protein
MTLIRIHICLQVLFRNGEAPMQHKFNVDESAAAIVFKTARSEGRSFANAASVLIKAGHAARERTFHKQPPSSETAPAS